MRMDTQLEDTKLEQQGEQNNGCYEKENLPQQSGRASYKCFETESGFEGRRKHKKIDYGSNQNLNLCQFEDSQEHISDENIEFDNDVLQTDEEDYVKCLGSGMRWGVGRRNMRLGVDMKKGIRDNTDTFDPPTKMLPLSTNPPPATHKVIPNLPIPSPAPTYSPRPLPFPPPDFTRPPPGFYTPLISTPPSSAFTVPILSQPPTTQHFNPFILSPPRTRETSTPEEASDDGFESCDSDEESTAEYFDAIETLETETNEELLLEPKTRAPGSAATRLLIHRSSNSRSCSPVDTVQQLGFFRGGIVRFVKEEGCTDSTLIQSALWPMVGRGYSVVGVAGEKSGKTVGWILPLVNQLTDWANYRKLKPGGGPRAVVLVEGRESVCKITRMLLELIHRSSIYLTVTEAIAGAEKDEMMVGKLINGVDILVTTPTSLIQLLEKRIMNLNRCCHLVLEEADRLLEWFPAQIKRVVVMWKKIDHQFVDMLHQTVVVSRQWTKMIKDFAEAFMKPDVLIVFEDLEEAAVYGALKVSPHLISDEDKLEKVVDLVRKKDLRRVVICCTNKDVGLEIVEHLDQFDVDSIFLHEELKDAEYDDVFDSWVTNEESPLIVTDEALLKIGQLVPAHLLIHWDLPQDRKNFGLRFLWLKPAIKSFHQDPALLAYDYYDDFKPECQILLSENDIVLDYVMDFLQRVGAVIPEKLALRHQDAMSNAAQAKLCQQVVLFGSCKDQVLGRCKGRHQLDIELDKPCEGRGAIVKFEVISVESPVQYQVNEKKTGEVRTVVVAGLVPAHGDIDWDDKVTDEVARKLTDIDAKKVVMRGRVLLSLGKILFLKQCQVSVSLPETNTFVQHFETRSDLISNGHALENSDHMVTLLELADSLAASLTSSKNDIEAENNMERNYDHVERNDENVERDDDKVEENDENVGENDCRNNVNSLPDFGKPDKLEETILKKDNMLAAAFVDDSGRGMGRRSSLSANMSEDEMNLSVEEYEDMRNLSENDRENMSNHSEDSSENMTNFSEDDFFGNFSEDDIYFEDQPELENYTNNIFENLLIKIQENGSSMFLPPKNSVPAASMPLPVSTPVSGNLLSLPSSEIVSTIIDDLIQDSIKTSIPKQTSAPVSDRFMSPIHSTVLKMPSNMPSTALVEEVSFESRKQLPIVWSQTGQRITLKLTPSSSDGTIPRDLSLDQVFVLVEERHINVQILEAEEEIILHTTNRLEMFDELDASDVNVKVKGRVLEVQLRSKEKRWKRLTKEKFGFINVDLDNCEEEEEDEEVREEGWGDYFDEEVGVECGVAEGYFGTKQGDRFSVETGERVLHIEDVNWTSNDMYGSKKMDKLLMEDETDDNDDICEVDRIEAAETEFVGDQGSRCEPALENYFDGLRD